MHKVGQLQSVQPEGQTSEELFCTLLFLEEYAFLRQACHWLQVFSGADAVVLYATPAPTTERSPPEAVAEWPEQYEFTQISESAQEFTRTDSTAPTSFTPQRQRSPRTTPVLVTHRVFVPNQEKRKRPAAYFLMQKWHDCTLQGEQVWPASQEDRLQAVVKKTALELEKLQQRSLQQLQETLYSDSLPAPVLTPQRYRQATQNLSISVWEWDLLANTVRNDGYLKKILGRQAVTSLDPFHWSEFVHPDDLPPVLQACQEVRQGVRRLMSVQYRMQHADGSWRWIRSQGQFLHDDPTTRLIIGTDCDITNEVQANESVSQLREELLHIARLSMGGEMAAGLAHEITQPMTAIRSYAAATRQLVATEAAVSLPAEILQYLTKIEFNAADASATLEGIRALFYPVNMQLVSITLGTLIDQAVSMMGTELQQRGITLVRDKQGDARRVKVNRTQLVHVLLNLLSNASHVLQQPVAGTAPMIAITSFADSHQHGFSVSDNGPGIPSDIQPKIFQAFVTTKPQGMGIGLAISKRIVEAHGGSIDFSPQIPSGTKFTITIP